MFSHFIKISNNFSNGSVKNFIFAVVAVFTSTWVHAEEKYRFIPYQPNSAVVQNTKGDENSIEVNYSFRYLISTPSNDVTRWEHFLTYTGKFDFYRGTRPSGPVINRLNNPAWHSRKYFNKQYFDWFDVGVEHKSNGQVTLSNELVPGTTQYKAAVEYNAGNHQYIDSISRGMDYLSFEVKKDTVLNSCMKCSLYLKLYSFHISEESNVYWGKYAGQNVKFADFERVKTVILIPFGKDSPTDLIREFSVEWTVGDKGLATDSATLWMKWPVSFSWGVLPLTIRAHYGSMNELSNYSESQRSIGVGLAFFH
jgi:hypothetical protein